MNVCRDCGNDELFVEVAEIKEWNLVNHEGEHLNQIYSETKAITSLYCNECKGTDIEEVEE